MRDLMMLSAMIILVPMAFWNGFAAYILWGWTAVLSPSYYMYGFMTSVRYNLIFALITLVLLLANKVKLQGKAFNTRTSMILGAFSIHATLCMAFSYSPNIFNETYYMFFIKAVIFCLVMPFFVDSRIKIHAFLIAFVLGLGFHGAVEGLKVIASGGGHKIQGMVATMLSDNNHFAIGMVIVIPILYYLYQYSERALVRWGFLFGALLTVLAVLGTNSRGGFVSIAVVGIWITLSSRRKLLSLVTVLVACVLIISFAQESWFSRMESIQSISEDSSFAGRVAAWNISSAIALSNPVFGGGLHALQNQWIWDSFKYAGGVVPFLSVGEVPEIAKAAHSVYFEILGDQGFVGLFLFLALMINGLITRNEVRKMVGGRTHLYWARDMADLLSVSLVAYLIGGAGVSLGYLEAIYIVLMLIEMLKQIVRREIANETVRPPNMAIGMMRSE